MKNNYSLIVASFVGVVCRISFSTAFVVPLNGIATLHTTRSALFTTTIGQEEIECNGICPEVTPGFKGVSASSLRNVQLNDSRGDTHNLGAKIGSDKSIVIFLRHLACPYCWAYAKEWCERQKILDKLGIGLYFVSIGSPKKLKKYLELNPFMKEDQMFVDGYKNNAYKETSLKTMGPIAFLNMKQPKLDPSRMFKFMSNFNSLAPPTENLGEIPDTVLMLGGTFVVDGDVFLYKWKDAYPGETPKIQEVLDVAAGNKLFAEAR